MSNDVPRDAAFGTIDAWLVHKLTGEHATDFTNASRTLDFGTDVLEDLLLTY